MVTSSKLNSWKEIATYLGRDIRTVLRWEKERGLPVRCVPGGKRRTVFAYEAELDDWLAGRHVLSHLNGNDLPRTTELVDTSTPRHSRGARGG